MPALRVLGGLAALVYFMVALRRYDRRQISRLNLILSCTLAVGVVALAISPSLFNPLFNAFNFKPGNDRRLIGVLFVAVIILFGLFLRVLSEADVNERNIRLLIESLGQREFPWDDVSRLPEGPRLVTVSPREGPF